MTINATARRTGPRTTTGTQFDFLSSYSSTLGR
jgi:hypothetical protein